MGVRFPLGTHGEYAPLAQLVEQLPLKEMVGGSNPSGRTKDFFTETSNMKWIFPIFLLIFFEFIADILAKQWSIHRGFMLATGALLSYLVANSFWLFALKNGSGLARGAVIFSVASGIIAVGLGLLVYKEEVTRTQVIGLVLGLISIGLIFWND